MNAEDLSGKVLSHYQLIRPLGAGGMGVVYLAKDTRLERMVAIKILPPQIASNQERMRRFVREAKAASAIDHPNIVHVYEIGEADGVHFIAMQHIEGQTLRSKINSRPLPLAELLQIAVQVTDAIAEAHSRGIIHRDIKSANIMVSKNEHVKLLDFGLARIETDRSAGDATDMETMSRTSPGTVIGTVTNMSPEQALGKEVDHRSDIFSMGTIFYEMATGQLPFGGNTVTETIDRIVHAQPESVIRLNYNVPQELERITRKCMEKDPSARYQSAKEILIDLKTLKRDLDSTPSAITGRKTHWRSYAVAMLSILIAVLAIAFVMYYRHTMRKQELSSLAVLPFKNINLDPKTEYLSDGITDSIINNVSLIRQLRVMARGTVFTYKNKDVDPRQVGKELGVDGVVTGKLLQEGNSISVTVDLVDARDGRQIWGEQYDRQLSDIISLQSEISKEISNKLRIKLSEKEVNLVTKHYTENPEAYQLYLQGQYLLLQRTPDSTQKAMARFHQAAERDPTFALAYAGLSYCYSFLGNTGAILGGLPPKEVMPKAKELALKTIQLDGDLAQGHTALGIVYVNYDWDWNATEREFNRALELNPNDSFTTTLRSFYFVFSGRKEEGFGAIKRFRDLDPGNVPGTLITVGIQYYMLREYDKAIQELRTVSEMAPNYPSPYFWLGAAYTQKKDYEKAIDCFQRAADYSHRSPVALSGLGFGLARAGKSREAEAVLTELLEERSKTYVPEFYIASLYGALGRKDEAFEWIEKGYSNHANALNTIKVNPLIDDLRSDPRFANLLHRLKLDS